MTTDNIAIEAKVDTTVVLHIDDSFLAQRYGAANEDTLKTYLNDGNWMLMGWDIFDMDDDVRVGYHEITNVVTANDCTIEDEELRSALTEEQDNG